LVDSTATGRIEADLSRHDENLPKVIIDGEEWTWEEFGRLWMTYEGFRFKLEMIDPVDDTEE
jgi:hypothetical protein